MLILNLDVGLDFVYLNVCSLCSKMDMLFVWAHSSDADVIKLKRVGVLRYFSKASSIHMCCSLSQWVSNLSLWRSAQMLAAIDWLLEYTQLSAMG